MSTKSKKKIILLSVSILLIVILTVTMLVLYYTVGHNFNKYYQPQIDFLLFDKDAVLSQAQVTEDRNELVENTENAQPYFEIKEIDGYEAAKQKFLSAGINTAGDFYFAAAEYLAVFNDLHTTAISAFTEYLTFGLKYYTENNKLMYFPYGDGAGAFELAKINGVSVLEIIGKYTSTENENTVANNFARLRICEFLKRAGIEWEDSLVFTYKNPNGTTFDVTHAILENSTDNSSETPKNFEAEITDENVLYVYARAMSDDGSYNECINFIGNAINNGIKKAVIDVRGNGGGSDGFSYGILRALGFEFSNAGFSVRYSKATAKYMGTWRKSGFVEKRQFEYKSKNNYGVELKVFCDELTASAAMAVVNQCRYSGLGQVLGRMPGQNTNFCGNRIIFQLPHSKVAYMLPLSYSYFKLNGEKAPDKFIPDTEVPALANYMDYVVWTS